MYLHCERSALDLFSAELHNEGNLLRLLSGQHGELQPKENPPPVLTLGLTQIQTLPVHHEATLRFGGGDIGGGATK